MDLAAIEKELLVQTSQANSDLHKSPQMTLRMSKAPINSQKKAEYERQQSMLLAIHEQEKMAWMKKLAIIQMKREKEDRKKLELKKEV